MEYNFDEIAAKLSEQGMDSENVEKSITHLKSAFSSLSDDELKAEVEKYLAIIK